MHRQRYPDRAAEIETRRARLPEGIGPTSVVRERLTRTSQDRLANVPELQPILTYRGDALCQPNAWRGTGPRPTMKGRRYFHRSAGALGCHTRIRAGFPRELHRHDVCFPPSVVCDRLITNGSRSAILTYRAWRANDGEGQVSPPHPTMKGRRYFHRSAGACPPRSPSSRCVFPHL